MTCKYRRIRDLFQSDVANVPNHGSVRSGGDFENIGGNGKYSKDIVCPDGCVRFRLMAKKLGNENFYKGKFLD